MTIENVPSQCDLDTVHEQKSTTLRADQGEGIRQVIERRHVP